MSNNDLLFVVLGGVCPMILCCCGVALMVFASAVIHTAAFASKGRAYHYDYKFFIAFFTGTSRRRSRHSLLPVQKRNFKLVIVIERPDTCSLTRMR